MPIINNIIDSDQNCLDEIVECHKCAFPKTWFTYLGNKFTRKMLLWYIVNNRGVLFHLEVEDKIIGYCGGIITLQPGLSGAASSISQYAFSEIVKAYVKKPWILFNKESRTKYRLITKNIMIRLGFIKLHYQNVINENFDPYMGIVVIAVLPDYHGKGLGGVMLDEFEKRANQQHVKFITLSVKPSNTKAIRAYTKSGWKEERRTSDSLQMIKRI